MSFLWCLHSYISEIDENPHPGGFENFVLPQMPKKSPKLYRIWLYSFKNCMQSKWMIVFKGVIKHLEGNLPHVHPSISEFSVTTDSQGWHIIHIPYLSNGVSMDTCVKKYSGKR